MSAETNHFEEITIVFQAFPVSLLRTSPTALTEASTIEESWELEFEYVNVDAWDSLSFSCLIVSIALEFSPISFGFASRESVKCCIDLARSGMNLR